MTEKEFNEAFKILNRNKASESDGLHVNFVTSAYEFKKEPLTQSAFTCSKLTVETVEYGAKYLTIKTPA